MLSKQRFAMALATVLALTIPAQAEKKPAKPKVEVVFCLDTTGSMGGLIQAAKDKIWSISNQIASGKPTPDLKVGLVAYRDKRDAYVTKLFDLSDDLDAVHGNLKGFQAQGGGDGPEHVNQALQDSVEKISWSKDAKTLRIIFLVGDAPPHMDYTDDVKYEETCKKAAAMGIIINSIQCGTNSDCARYWRDICAKAEGSYVQIEQSGGVVAVATPFDKELAAISDEMAKNTLVYGTRGRQAEGKDKLAEAMDLAPAAKADRAAFGGKSGTAARYDLLDALKRKEVELEKLKKDELPEQLQKLNVAEQKVYLEKLSQNREELQKKAVELDRKRNDFIQAELKKKGKEGLSAFDNQVLEMLRKQAKRASIDY